MHSNSLDIIVGVGLIGFSLEVLTFLDIYSKILSQLIMNGLHDNSFKMCNFCASNDWMQSDDLNT